jgi:transposase
VITDATRMCELLVGLPDVNVLGVTDDSDSPLVVHVELRLDGGVTCAGCGGLATVKERTWVEFVDLPSFGRRTRLRWRKHRLECLNDECPVGSWTAQAASIAAPRLSLTDRAGRWVTFQVGKHGRTVTEVAHDLGCGWHAVNDAVMAYGTPLVDDPERIGKPVAVGLDETMFRHVGQYREQCWSTQIVDVSAGYLLDIVEGRTAAEPCKWFAKRSAEWLSGVRWATLDLSASYRSVFNTMLPDATQVADPFHVVRVANTALDECRRRVQQDTTGHRGLKNGPLYRVRRRLAMAAEQLTEHGRQRLVGLLRAGDPTQQVWFAWNAKEVTRQTYAITDPALARQWVAEICRDFTDESMPIEVRRLGRTIKKWRNEIVAWHDAHVSNGPTEAINNLIKRVKRVAFGFNRFENYRVRSLLYAGRPNWDLLATITPR